MALHVLAYNMKRVMKILGRWRIDGSNPRGIETDPYGLL